jgi:hypothetical protein
LRLRTPGPGREAALRILPILVLLPVHWIITHGAYWPAAVLCSPPEVPLLLLVLGAGFAQLRPRLLPLVWVATAILLANNAMQMQRIDEGLGRIERSRGVARSAGSALLAGASATGDRLHSRAP